MATSTADLLRARLKEVAADKDKQEASLEKAKEAFRAAPDESKRGKLNEIKAATAKICDEYADLARAVSAMSGGTNHAPAPTG